LPGFAETHGTQYQTTQGLLLHTWGEEAVAYVPCTGDTHLVGALSLRLLFFLKGQTTTLSDLAEVLPADAHELESVLAVLAEKHLIEAV
jgi:hypothetical protein